MEIETLKASDDILGDPNDDPETSLPTERCRPCAMEIREPVVSCDLSPQDLQGQWSVAYSQSVLLDLVEEILAAKCLPSWP